MARIVYGYSYEEMKKILAKSENYKLLISLWNDNMDKIFKYLDSHDADESLCLSELSEMLSDIEFEVSKEAFFQGMKFAFHLMKKLDE